MDVSEIFPPYPDRKPLLPGFTWTSQYLTVRDGTRLAVDVYLPKGLSPSTKLPTLLFQSRYWRVMIPNPPVSWFIDDMDELVPATRGLKAFFTRRGYALVYVDVRGTGASFGVWRYPWEPVTIQDACDVLDWIVARPWSNGKVAGIGISYLGTTAELLLATRHPAVKAVVPMYNHPDAFIDTAFPGGLFNARFIQAWSHMDMHLDLNQIPPELGVMARWIANGVRPVNGDRAALSAALNEHRMNGNTFQMVQNLVFRDDIDPGSQASADDLAMHRFNQAIADSQVPSLGWASWMDAGTADAAIRRFHSYPGADRTVIGAWNHGGLMQASPYQSPRASITPSIENQRREILRFLDTHLMDVDDRYKDERLVKYYTLGLETWQQSSTWPPIGVRLQRWYLSDGRKLSLSAPDGDVDQDSEDLYTVDFQSTSGLLNRWWELGPVYNQTVEYPDRAVQDADNLTYQTPPFERDLEIDGYPIISLEVVSSEPDCAFYVYLEDIAPNGRVCYLTEGMLRAIHRKVCATPPYSALTPFHSYRQADAMPLIPGEPAQITFGLLPVSALVRAGHSLRVSLAGHDADTFTRTPQHGTPHWRVLRNHLHASWIDLPISSN